MATTDKRKSKSVMGRIPINDGKEICVHWNHHVLSDKKSGLLRTQWVEIVLTVVRTRTPEEKKPRSELIKVGGAERLSFAPDWKIRQDVKNWLFDKEIPLTYLDPVMDTIKDLKK